MGTWHEVYGYHSRRILVVLAALCCAAAVTTSTAHGAAGHFCSDTANLQFKACTSEVVDDHFQARAICTNLEETEERQECFADAETDRRDARAECSEQRAARLDLCGDLGEARYDPDFDAADFDSDFGHLTHANPYFPLGIGNRWEYGGGESIVYPGVAPVAMQEGRYAARAIKTRLAGGTPTPFRYRDKGNLATIGRARAVADIKGLELSGFLAWATWLLVHLWYLIGFQNRILVLIRWAVSFFSHGRGARLIAHEPGR